MTVGLNKLLEHIGELSAAERDRFLTLVHDAARDGHTPAKDFADLLSQHATQLAQQRRPSPLLRPLQDFERLVALLEKPAGGTDKPLTSGAFLARLERGKGNLVVSRVLEDLGWTLVEQELAGWLASGDAVIAPAAAFKLGQAFSRAATERDKRVKLALVADLQLAIARLDGPAELAELLDRLALLR